MSRAKSEEWFEHTAEVVGRACDVWLRNHGIRYLKLNSQQRKTVGKWEIQSSKRRHEISKHKIRMHTNSG